MTLPSLLREDSQKTLGLDDLQEFPSEKPELLAYLLHLTQKFQALEMKAEEISAAAIAFLGQKFGLYVSYLKHCTENPATGRNNAEHWTRFVIERADCSAMDAFFGEGVGEAFRKRMLELGEHCLCLAEEASDSISSSSRPESRAQLKFQEVRS